MTFRESITVTRSPRGNWFVSATLDPGKVVEYDTAGRRILRVHGRRGNGPGEFMAAGPPLFLSDTLVIFDLRLQRVATFTSDQRLFATANVPGRITGYLALPDGNLLVNGVMQSAAHVGYPLHVISRSGRVLSSFGADLPSYRADLPVLQMRKLASSPDGRFWAAGNSTFEIELWDAGGTRHLHLTRAGGLFEPWERSPGPVQAVRPNSSLTGVWQEGGHLWLTFLVPDANWRPTVNLKSRAETPLPPLTPEELKGLWDTVVEVVDFRTARVVARTRFDAVMRPTFEGGYMYHYVEGSDGMPSFQVLRPTLRQ
ncbi:MAG TPA: hypothetical protein VMN60_12600 [Longimicrobiales bacterium]|nr:hypothetical protein [Longimicrobiales bacterium]